MPKLDTKSADKYGYNNFRGVAGRNFGKPLNPSDAMTFAVPSYTTAERDKISNTTNGMIIYNLTLNKLQARENGAWVNII